MNKQEIVDYLSMDLKPFIIEDITPCLQIGFKTRAGFFSVPKLVLTCVDYLGALYVGWNNERKNGRPVFTSGPKAKAYLRDLFGQVYAEYKTHGDLLWEIYRHGTVHLNEPKVLQNGTRTISWQLFKGDYKQRKVEGGGVPTAPGKFVRMDLTHLVPAEIVGLPGEWMLPVCTTCLYEDLVASIDQYVDLIQSNSAIEDSFRKTVNEMVKPEITGINWP
jgi:hypothetical protein